MTASLGSHWGLNDEYESSLIRCSSESEFEQNSSSVANRFQVANSNTIGPTVSLFPKTLVQISLCFTLFPKHSNSSNAHQSNLPVGLFNLNPHLASIVRWTVLDAKHLQVFQAFASICKSTNPTRIESCALLMTLKFELRERYVHQDDQTFVCSKSFRAEWWIGGH